MLELERAAVIADLQAIAAQTDAAEDVMDAHHRELDRIELTREIAAQRLDYLDQAVALTREATGFGRGATVAGVNDADSLLNRIVIALGDGRARTVVEIATMAEGDPGSVMSRLSELVVAGRASRIRRGGGDGRFAVYQGPTTRG